MMMVIVAGVAGAVVSAAAVYAVMAAKVASLKVEAARQDAERDAQRQLLEAQKRHYEAVIAQGEAQFKTLAQKILEERSAALKKEGAESIGNLLAPLQRQIAEFKARVDAVNSEDVKRMAELTKGIEVLVRQTNTVSEQANNLATAIRSDAQVTGAWGESQLKRVLELGGLQQTVHYDYQETFASPGSDRKDLRTDVLVKMPDDRWLVIDAKTTMAAYVDYVRAEADATAAQAREVSRERIVASVKNHVDELKNAAYHRNLSATTGKKLLDTMLMYIPFDEVFLIAMKAEINVAGERVLLREYARRNDVVFVNSSSLMPVIRLIEMLWAQDKADRKALKIKDSAEALIEKFNGFLTAADGFMAIGKHLGDAVKCYNSSLKRLATGHGNVIKKLSDMKEMGVSSAAKLPPPEEVETRSVAVEVAAKALLLAFLAVGTAFGGVEGGPWRCVGPGGGGWIEDLLYSRHAPNRLWVGCDVGGVYLSEDGGRHYEMRSDGFKDFFIESLTEHPTNPDILFAASHGIYKTTDRGKTWVEKRQGLPQPQAYSYAISIARIVFDPRDANRLYAAVGNARLGKGDDKRHLYVSTDCGESWREVVAPDQFPSGTRLHDLVVDPRDGDRLVAATSTGVYRSTDGGVHWQAAGGLPSHGRVRRVALAPSAPDVIYATLRQKGGEKPWAAGVYRSDDGGRTFSPRNGGLSCRPGVAGAGDMLSDWYDRIVVDPRNCDVAYLGGATWWAPGVFKTTDGGARWTRITRHEKGRPADGWLEPPGHPAVASLALSPLDPEKLAYGTDFLVRCSDDGGASWRPAYTARRTDGKSSTIGLETTCVKEVVADPHRRGRFLCAFLDIGAWTTSDNGETFEAKFVNDNHSCFSIAQSPTEPDLVWQLAGSHGRVADASRRVLVSWDGCRSWQPVLKDPPEWMHPKSRDLVCLTDRAPYRLACLTVRGVATSADGGATWSLLATNALPVAARVSRLKRLGATIYAGTAANDREGGAIWKSLDRGVTWTKVEGLPASAGGVSDIAVDGDRIIVTTGEHYVRAEQRMLKGGAWLSTDAGRTWRQVYKARACRCCAFSRGRLLVGIGYDSFFDHYAVGGVWLSDDAGTTWQSLNDRSLVNRNVNAITVDPFDADSIWVATQGNAIFTRRLR